MFVSQYYKLNEKKNGTFKIFILQNQLRNQIFNREWSELSKNLDLFVDKYLKLLELKKFSCVPFFMVHQVKQPFIR